MDRAHQGNVDPINFGWSCGVPHHSSLAVINADVMVSGNRARPVLDGNCAPLEDGMISDVGIQTVGFASNTCSNPEI